MDAAAIRVSYRNFQGRFDDPQNAQIGRRRTHRRVHIRQRRAGGADVEAHPASSKTRARDDLTDRNAAAPGCQKEEGARKAQARRNDGGPSAGRTQESIDEAALTVSFG